MYNIKNYFEINYSKYPLIPTNPNSNYALMYGGLSSAITGGNFLEGAAIGLVVTALNHALHEALDPDPTQQQKGNEKMVKNILDEKIKFFKRLRSHYESKTGESFKLTNKEFYFLMETALNENLIDFNNQNCNGISCLTTVDFYKSKSEDLKYSFGKASIHYSINQSGTKIINGFYDYYDFDPKPWGIRTLTSELITRGYNFISNGKSFKINYP